VARGRVARGRARGGEGIPALRPSRAPLAAALGALAAAAGVAAYAGLRPDEYGPGFGVLGGVGVAVLALGLALRASDAIPVAVVVLGGAYAGSLFVGPDRLDPAAPLVGGGLVLAAELGYWTLELRPRVDAEPSVLRRRVLLELGAVAASVAAGGALLGIGWASPGGGPGWDVLGVVAAIAALTLVARLAGRPSVDHEADGHGADATAADAEVGHAPPG
jgi:hypothetical protein